MFENIEDILDLLPANPLGRLEDGDDLARKAVEDPDSEEFKTLQKAIAAGALIKSSPMARKVVEGVVSDPVGKAKKIKRLASKAIPTTGVELPPEIPKEIIDAAKKKSSKATGGSGKVFEKLIEENAGHTGKIKSEATEELTEEIIEKVVKKGGKEAAEEGAEATVKKGLGKLGWKGKLGGILLAGLVLNQLGDKKEKKKKSTVTNFVPTVKKKKESTRDTRMEQFNQFRDDIRARLKTLEN